MKSALLLGLFAFVALAKANEDSSFVDVDSDFKRIHRNLLQEYDTVSDDGGNENEEEEEEAKPAPKGIVEAGMHKTGPKLFYDGHNFLMRLSRPIRVTIFPGANMEGSSERPAPISHVDLNEEAVSIVGGGGIQDDNFKVNIDWKNKQFGNDFKIRGIQINMFFRRDSKEFFLEKLDVVNLDIDGKVINSNPLEATTKNGYKVAAPLGSSFCCYDPGMFMPLKPGGNQYHVGVTFPGMQVQAFEVTKPDRPVRFGPEWDCSSFMTIGLLVGLLLSLSFAIVCYWGFSMLANIQTMDRFDDPKGKPINVPQTD